jgi:glycosyltransferase involved in cell wall biosynthesis
MGEISPLPLITAIIPTLNRPHMLVRAVKSVAKQTYPNLEIIIVDDGSQYNIQDLIKKECDGLICRVLTNTRRSGGSGARNEGFNASKGDYIAFLDDDDEWLPEKIFKQFEALQQSNEMVGIVCTHDIRIHGNLKIVRTRYLEGNVYRTLCREHIVGNSSNPLMKRHAFEEAGFFDEDMPAAQDTDLWLRMAKRFDFTTVNEPLVHIYHHGSTQITKNIQKQLMGSYLLIRKHGKDLHKSRKYRILKWMLRLMFLLAQEKMFRHEVNKRGG